jgi:hypothetical protein
MPSIPMKLAIDWALDVCFHLILDTGRKIQTRMSKLVVHWQKPEAGFVKINKDDSFQDETLVGATGAVIRDENGTFLKAMARCIPAVGSALMVEVEAWLDGLRLLGPEPQGKVILESDSLGAGHSLACPGGSSVLSLPDSGHVFCFLMFSVHNIKRVENTMTSFATVCPINVSRSFA